MIRILNEDCLVALPRLAAEGFRAHSCVTDPPYHIEFMGKSWDGGDIALRPETWRLVFDCMLPGAYLLAFGSTRTYHRMVCAIEDAGFSIRDSIAYLYGSGFPKNLNVTSALRNSLPADALCACVPDCPKTVQGSQSRYQEYRGSDGEPPQSESNSGRDGAPLLFDALAHSRADLHPDDQASATTSISVDEASDRLSSEHSQTRTLPPSEDSQGIGTSLSDKTESTSHALPAQERGRTGLGIQDTPRSGGGSAFFSRKDSLLTHPNMANCGVCGKVQVPEGLGTALKPAMELICMARKPFRGTVAANVLAHGTGAINIDACRISASGRPLREKQIGKPDVEGHSVFGAGLSPESRAVGLTDEGRWPANVIHDGSEEVEAAFAAFGEAPGQQRAVGPQHGKKDSVNCYGDYGARRLTIPREDKGTASRFFYTSKADATDRAGSKHPTVKPTSLMEYLVRLVTPVGGTVLDPFAGTGSTGLAADRLGCDAVLIERDTTYAADIERKITGDCPLFAELSS